MAGVKGKSGRGRKTLKDELELRGLIDSVWKLERRRKVITKLSTLAETGDVKAAGLLLAYAYGKPTERTEITGKDGGPIRTRAEDLSDDELAAIAER